MAVVSQCQIGGFVMSTYRPERLEFNKPTCKGVVVFGHGLAQHGEAFLGPPSYSDALRALADQGYLVLAYSLPGHGSAPGQRGHFTRPQFLAAVEGCVTEARRRNETMSPIYFVGWSLSGQLMLKEFDTLAHHFDALCLHFAAPQEAIFKAVARGGTARWGRLVAGSISWLGGLPLIGRLGLPIALVFKYKRVLTPEDIEALKGNKRAVKTLTLATWRYIMSPLPSRLNPYSGRIVLLVPEHDALPWDALEATRQMLPAAAEPRTLLLRGGGHSMIRDQWATWAQALGEQLARFKADKR